MKELEISIKNLKEVLNNYDGNMTFIVVPVKEEGHSIIRVLHPNIEADILNKCE